MGPTLLLGQDEAPMGGVSTHRDVLAHVTVHRDQAAERPSQDFEVVVLLRTSVWEDVIAGPEHMLAWLGGG